MEEISQGDDNRFIPMSSVRSGHFENVTTGVYYFTQQIVNVIFIQDRYSDDWVLVDAGMPFGGKKIIEMAEEHFGKKAPSAILLTHGHFDHVGGIKTLLEKWDVPVFAHPDEFPYLQGKLAYPDADNSVEGGMLAKISSIYPVEPINISTVLQPLPRDGSVPYLQGWRWIHVPGHSPGQVAFFRASDKVLVSGDAIITVRQDALYKVLIQKKEVCGPPVYLTTDWAAAELSARKLAELEPQWLVAGHGTAMQGNELAEGISQLIANFRITAVPDHGKWVQSRESDNL